MERESFSSPQVAELLNNNFIPIKIDREERPDIDAVYMSYVQATTGSGGWPLNIFVTPDLEPVFGGTVSHVFAQCCLKVDNAPLRHIVWYCCTLSMTPDELDTLDDC